MFKYKLTIALFQLSNFVANKAVNWDTSDRTFLDDEDAVYSLGLKILKYGEKSEMTKEASQVIATVLVKRMLSHQKK